MPTWPLQAWSHTLVPACRMDKAVLVAADNSSRTLVKYVDNISGGDIFCMNILNGVALVCELDDALNPIRHYYLSDTNVAAKAAAAITAHAKA